MKLGFIGTGKITSSVVTGICRSKISFKKILVSLEIEMLLENLKNNLEKYLLQKTIKK